MSSSMETNLLLSDAEPGPRHWRDVDIQKWEAKSDECPAMILWQRFCRITNHKCDYNKCFGRYWGVM